MSSLSLSSRVRELKRANNKLVTLKRKLNKLFDVQLAHLIPLNPVELQAQHVKSGWFFNLGTGNLDYYVELLGNNQIIRNHIIEFRRLYKRFNYWIDKVEALRLNVNN